MLIFLLNLFNSHNIIFSRSIRYSIHNSGTPIIGENVRYFMYKHKIVYKDSFNDLSNIINRINNHVTVVSYHLLITTRYA